MTQYIKLKAILYYPHLSKPHQREGQDEAKYECGILIAKNDPQIFALDAAIDTEIKNSFPNGFPSKGKLAKKDGIQIWPDKPHMHDYFLINTSAKAESKPHVVSQGPNGTQPVIDPGEIRTGDYAWFAIALCGFDKAMNKGVAAYLNGVLLSGEKSAIADKLGGAPSADQLFADLLKPAAATPPPKTSSFGDLTPVAPPAAPTYTMTLAANGLTREAYHASGWSDQQLIEHGYMVKS